MRRYKLAVHILVILSVFNLVPVFAAPVAVQEVRETCADVADGGQDVVTLLGKRAGEGQDSSTPVSPGPASAQPPTSPPHPPSASDFASGVHQETTNPIQPPSSASGEIKRPPYASGGTELPWHSSDDTEPHLLNPDRGGVQQGATRMLLPSSSMRTKTYPFVSTSEIGPATPSESSGEISPASGSRILSSLPSEHWQEGYVDPWQTPPKQPEPQPKTVWGKLASKSKIFLKKLGRISKSLVSEMVSNPRLQIRISATASGAVNPAQRELQGTVHAGT